jgi:chemotaxis protein methyltransferase CheR
MIESIAPSRADLEIKKIVKELYAVNLDGYHELYLERRLTHYFRKKGIEHPSMIRDLVINQPHITLELQKELQITYTRLFREPAFFRKVIQLAKVLQRRKSEIRIWHAGCSNGSEAYSLAILLKEENIIDKCTIYATDINRKALSDAKKGVLTIKEIQATIGDYITAGGKHHLTEYFNLNGENAVLKTSILNQIQFAKHELGKDHSFHEFDIIICRNMLIYYQDFHQQKLVAAMKNSLCKGGYLGLSNCESLEGIADKQLSLIDSSQNIYQYLIP